MTQQTIQPWQYWLGVGFAGLLTVGGAAMILFGISFMREASAAKSWPTAEGKIQAVNMIREVDRNGSTKVVTHHLTISYGYEVDGISYTGDRYSLGNGSTASKRFSEQGKAIAEKKKYPIGDPIDVFYKPDEPSFAVLKPGLSFGTFVPLTLGILFLPSGIVLGLAALRNPIK